MNYQDTISFLYTRLPMFSRIGSSAIKKDLTNTLALCERLGQPQNKFRTIHIAGTNGKGSTSHMLAAILQSAGYKTGLYTSPHLHDFRERIRVNGVMARENFVVEFTQRVMPWLDEIEPSFFEITVAMAFEYFAEEEVDVAVIETGLGGRLDSTNVILPELSVITNIGWDHMAILGNTLPQIASEKAGIIKPGVPVVIGESHPETRPVFEEKAISVGAPIVFADELRFVNGWNLEHHLLRVEVGDHHHTDHEIFELDLTGIYQLKNLVTVLETVHQLENLGWKINRDHIRTALKQVKKMTGLRGRWDLVHQRPRVVLDVGHNEDGVRQILNQINVTEHRSLHLVLGMVKDKDVDKVLSMLPHHARYYFTNTDIPRALNRAELKDKAEALGLNGSTYDNVNLAIKAAMAVAGPEDLIVVFGSVFLVGEVTSSQ